MSCRGLNGNFCVLVAAVLAAVTPVGCTKTGVAPVVAPAQPVDQSFRAQAPAAGAPQPLHAPVPQQRQLDNGLRVLAVEKPGLPLVHVRVIVRSGSAADPADGLGMAGFVASMLERGSTSRDARAVADAIETRGATLHVSVDEDASTLSFTALKENYGPVLEVLADILQDPAFAADEVERVRAERLAALTQLDNDPPSAATRVFRHVIYGDHPYGHSVLGQREALKKIKPAALRAFYRRLYRPANIAVVVVGDLDAEAMFAAVAERFSAWSDGEAGDAAVPPPEPAEPDPGIYLVERQGAPQSQLRIGHLGVSRSNEDYFAVVMCNAILGGLFNSRINMNLREDKGYTYGARSTFDFLRSRGPFFVATGVRTDVTKEAIEEVFKEIDRMVAQGAVAEELQNAKNRYALSLPGSFQSVARIAGMVQNIFVYDLPVDYYQTLPEKIAAVTLDDVHRVAKTYLHSAALNIVVVGDRSKVETGLAELKRGTVALCDAEGNIL